MSPIVTNTLTISTTLICLLVLFHKKIITSPTWHATITPLASVIGSGFLVSAPLLLLATGEWAALVMLIIVTIAYGIGSSLRYNIQYLEPLLQQSQSTSSWVNRLEIFSRPALGIAYIISVAFYLKLLSAFALRGTGLFNPIYENMLTTFLLLFIGITGKRRGLHMLEVFEIYSVNTKLAIIAAIIVGHSLFNINLLMEGEWHLKLYPHDTLWMALRKLLGVLIIIQGFETSRYLGQAYDQAMRIRTMRYAQIISGIIYVVFITSTMVAFNDIHTLSETTVIDLCRMIAPVLPLLLIIAAVMSQFSAAIADTVGSAGLLSEATRQKLTVNTSYLIITSIAIGLTWLTNIYEIIVIASKAFAIYYAFQLLIACLLLAHQKHHKKNWVRVILYSLLFFLMVLVILLGIPVE